MGDYAKLGKDQTENILKLYDIGSLRSFVALSLGISNSNYKLETESGTYLLKVSNDKDQTQLCSEQEILTYLQGPPFDYSIAAIPTLEGSLIYAIGEYFGVIFPFIEGIPPGPADHTCCEIGRAIGSLHALKITPAELQEIRSHEEVGFGGAEILEYTKSDECPADFRDNFNFIFKDKLNGWNEEEMQLGIVHGDLYYDNTLFAHNKLKVILDWEQAGRGPLLLDLGICIGGTCLEKGRIIQPLINSFLSGYGLSRSLPKEEEKLLNQAIILGLFSIARWRISRFVEKDLDPLMRDSYKELLYRASNFNIMIEMLKSEKK